MNWTDSERLCQRNRAHERKALAPVLVLTLGTDRLIPLFDLDEWDGSDAASCFGILALHKFRVIDCLRHPILKSVVQQLGRGCFFLRFSINHSIFYSANIPAKQSSMTLLHFMLYVPIKSVFHCVHHLIGDALVS